MSRVLRVQRLGGEGTRVLALDEVKGGIETVGSMNGDRIHVRNTAFGAFEFHKDLRFLVAESLRRFAQQIEEAGSNG